MPASRAHSPTDAVGARLNQGRWRASEQAILGRGWIRSTWAGLRALAAGEYWLLFARSYLCRKLYAALRSLHERALPTARCPLGQCRASSIFSSLSSDEAVQSLHDHGIYSNLRLPATLSEEIRQYAERNLCTRWGFTDAREERFLIDEVKTGELPDGRLVCIADVDAPSSCRAIEQIAFDPGVLGLFYKRYGYRPTRVIERLYWSLALSSDHPAMRFRPNRGGLFHYDVGGLSSMYAYFYLTRVDRTDGAHVVIPRSHRKKAIPLLFGSRYKSDATIDRHYGKPRALAIEGDAGAGFIEDPACFHKYARPIERNRLMLQLRYS